MIRPVVTGAALCTVVLLTLGCEGFGRPIVGVVPTEDAGRVEEGSCAAVGPMCVPPRSLPPSHFDVRTAPGSETRGGDCDADRVEDAVDNCLGVPNPTQAPGVCESARTGCERLRAGALDLEGADLRGCRIDEPLRLEADVNLRGARLSCARLAFRAAEPGAYVVDVSGAEVRASELRVEGDGASVELRMNRTIVDGSDIEVEGTAWLCAPEASITQAHLYLRPRGEAPVLEAPLAGIDLSGARLERSSVYEAASTRAAGVRVERASVAECAFDVRSLELIASEIEDSRLAAAELHVHQAALRRSAVRAPDATLASSTFDDVVFAECGDLRISDSELVDVDVPLCEPGRFRAFRTAVGASRIAGGLELVESALASSVIGAGPSSLLVTRNSEVDGVTFCDLGAAAFYGGELICVHCAADAFMEGRSVCVSGANLRRRGCPPIELAPSCE